MRNIKTFILRLVIFSDQPGGLCGSLQQVSAETVTPFRDEKALLELLHRHNQEGQVEMDDGEIIPENENISHESNSYEDRGVRK